VPPEELKPQSHAFSLLFKTWLSSLSSTVIGFTVSVASTVSEFFALDEKPALLTWNSRSHIIRLTAAKIQLRHRGSNVLSFFTNKKPPRVMGEEEGRAVKSYLNYSRQRA